jgi:hypothetical protein
LAIAKLSGLSVAGFPMLRFHLTWAVALLGCCIIGCSGPERPVKDYKWNLGKGRILIGAAPFKGGGSVQFSPANDPNFTAEGPIRSDGTFVLSTVMHNPRKSGEGVPVGEYDVRVLSAEAGQGGQAILVPGKLAVTDEASEIIVKLK